MANVMRIDTEFFELCSGDFSQGNDLLAWKQLKKSVQRWQTRGPLRFRRGTVAQHAATPIEGVPRERVPQNEFGRLHANLQ